LLIGLLLTLVMATAAAPATLVQYTLTFYKPVNVIGMDGVTAAQRVEGTIGGVVVSGEYDATDWIVGPLVSPTATLASGTLTCGAASCTLIITNLLGRETNMRGASFTFERPVSGPVSAFATRSAWVSAVARWADDQHLKPELKVQIVAQATGGEGHPR